MTTATQPTSAFPVPLTGTHNTLLWTAEDQIEHEAVQQLYRISKLPWLHGLRVMPDVHYGQGATVGSVIAMKDALSPAAVGVDIGCGMAAVRTSLTASDLPDDLSSLRSKIEAAIPVGMQSHREAVDLRKLRYDTGFNDFDELWSQFGDLHPKVSDLGVRAGRQLGTLGGGNHFIEVCLDEDDQVWLMLHSGSRYIGNILAQVHIEKAKGLPHNKSLTNKDLAVFLADSPEMDAYIRDLTWAQRYAARSRAVMIALVKQVLADSVRKVRFREEINCHHNYVAWEQHEGVDLIITRKGAIRAGVDEWGLIPGSMGTGSYVVRGLGSVDSYCSASHGAGRTMSRNQARKRFTQADLKKQTAGVECRKDLGVVDEIPGAYKDIDQVIENQKDLVQVYAKLRQIICVKG